MNNYLFGLHSVETAFGFVIIAHVLTLIKSLISDRKESVWKKFTCSLVIVKNTRVELFQLRTI